MEDDVQERKPQYMKTRRKQLKLIKNTCRSNPVDVETFSEKFNKTYREDTSKEDDCQ